MLKFKSTLLLIVISAKFLYFALFQTMNVSLTDYDDDINNLSWLTCQTFLNFIYIVILSRILTRYD